MHIRITPLDTPSDEVVAPLETRPGLLLAHVLHPMDMTGAVLVTAWESAGHADAVPLAAGGQRYEGELLRGVDADRPAAYAQVVTFDGPRSSEQVQAMDRADRERLWPAVRDLPGQVATLVGRGEDGSAVVVALTTSMHALERGQDAVMSTELLPGEDPSLLTGPDRVRLAWVLAGVSPTRPRQGVS